MTKSNGNKKFIITANKKNREGNYLENPTQNKTSENQKKQQVNTKSVTPIG